MGGVKFSIADMQKLKLVQVNGGMYEKISRQQVKKEKIQKLPNLLEKAKSKNKKIMNATKVTNEQGVKFDSSLEQYMYDLLTGAGIDFLFQVDFLLQKKFRFHGEAIRSIKIILDFYLPVQNIYIDTKGWQTYDGKIKFKMLKNCLVNTGLVYIPTIEMPATKKECDLLLNRILYDK